MIQDIELYTADGRLVETVQDPIVGMMGANGKPPEVVVWGERVFVLAPPDAYRPGTIRYREGMAWALRLGQEATAMPSPRVDGALAGLTLLPVSTGAAIPRAETTEDDIPDAQKMTESYKPPEDENPGQHLARLGTDGWIWTQDFMYRFPGAVDEDSEGVGKRPDAGTMLGWFANAIETGRAAGYGQGRAAEVGEAGCTLVALSRWIDESAVNATRDREAATWGRLAKLSEEVGEVIAAYIGTTGQNPRKGVTHEMADVEKELLDVAITALAAYEHVTGHRGHALSALFEHVARTGQRAFGATVA